MLDLTRLLDANRSLPRYPSPGAVSAGKRLEHDPEKWVPVFPRDKREAFARRSCSNKKVERDDDSKKSHLALAGSRRGALGRNRLGRGLCGAGLGRRAVPAAGGGRGVDGGVGLRLGGK